MGAIRIHIIDPTDRTPVAAARAWRVRVHADGPPPEVELQFTSRSQTQGIGIGDAVPPEDWFEQPSGAASPLADDLVTFVRACCSLPRGRLTVVAVSRQLGVPRRTLSFHFKRLGLPAPHLVLDACRLVLVGYDLSHRRIAIEAAAIDHGFGSSSNFRRMLRWLFGLRPGELRQEAGWQTIVEAFRAFVAPTTHGGGLRRIRSARSGKRSLGKIAMICLTVLGTGSLSAQAQPDAGATIAGTVTEATSRAPVGLATIAIEGTTFSTTSDPTGRYRLEHVPAGPQVIRVIRIGYAPSHRSLVIPATGLLTIDLVIARSALNLPGLVVTAEPRGRARGELGTASVIESEAIRNQTAASLAGVLELVPGVTLQPPGLDGVQQFSLRSVPISVGGGGFGSNARGPSANQLASFGTQVILDGVPISNNANLQSLGPRGELQFASSAGGGIDLRRIPAATVERVEVIRGLPSARFGDLTQGAVLIDTRAGVIDPEFRIRLDARTVEGSMVAGRAVAAGGRQALSASADVARTRIDPGARDDIASRVSVQLAHRSTGRRLTIDTRFDGFQVLEDSPETPLIRGFASRSRDAGLRVSERARLNVGAKSRIEFTGAFEGVRQRSFSQANALRPAAPFTNALEEGRYVGKYIGGEYLARVDVQGDPRHLYSRLEAITPGSRWGFSHQLRAGLELRREWNGGPGYQFDIEFPPQTQFNGVQGYDRPRRFDLVPAIVTSAIYLDDYLGRSLGSWQLNLQAGLRLDGLHSGRSWLSGFRDQVLQPRLVIELAPAATVRFRGSAGRVAKVPSLDQLYPAPQYSDVINVNYFANNPAERLAVLTTGILDKTNKALGYSRADKAEVAVEIDLGGSGGQIALLAYSDRIRGGVGIDAAPTFLLREHFALGDSSIGTGHPPVIVEPAFLVDSVPILIDRPTNNLLLRSTGLEFTAALPEWKAARTQIAFLGAYSKSRLETNSLQFVSSFVEFQVNENAPRAPYWVGATRTGDRLLLTTRAIHHQPEAGLVITGTLQYHLRERRQDLGSTDTLSFEGFMTRGGALVPVPADRRADPQYADLRVTRSGLRVEPQTSPADWLFNLQVSKTLPFDGRLAFYAFNAFDRVGTYGDGIAISRIYPRRRFGLEVTFPLGLNWGSR